jgi:hypothetical protein
MFLTISYIPNRIRTLDPNLATIQISYLFLSTSKILRGSDLTRIVPVFTGEVMLKSAYRFWIQDLSVSIPPQKAIKTFNFVIGGSSSTHRRVGRKFLFGETQRIRLPEIVSSLEQLLDRDRNLVFVSHRMEGDQTLLKVLGFDLETSVVGVLDTEDLAQHAFGGPKLRLRRLLTKLNCPFDNLHCAGNDAHFALRALLLLAVQSYLGFDVDDVARDRLEMLQAIDQAPFPLPCLSTPIAAALAEEDKDDAIDESTRAAT